MDKPEPQGGMEQTGGRGLTIRVQIACSLAPRQIEQWQIEVAAGSCISDVLASVSGHLQVNISNGMARGEWKAGVWGERAELDRELQDGDRLEFYRMLRVDPKVARRERFSSQGVGTAGLFANRRKGAKPGY